MADRWRDVVVEGYELGRRRVLPHVSIDKSFPRGHGVPVSISSTEALGFVGIGYQRLGVALMHT